MENKDEDATDILRKGFGLSIWIKNMITSNHEEANRVKSIEGKHQAENGIEGRKGRI